MNFDKVTLHRHEMKDGTEYMLQIYEDGVKDSGWYEDGDEDKILLKISQFIRNGSRDDSDG